MRQSLILVWLLSLPPPAGVCEEPACLRWRPECPSHHSLPLDVQTQYEQLALAEVKAEAIERDEPMRAEA